MLARTMRERRITPVGKLWKASVASNRSSCRPCDVRALLGDRGECARCRNGDLTTKALEFPHPVTPQKGLGHGQPFEPLNQVADSR